MPVSFSLALSLLALSGSAATQVVSPVVQQATAEALTGDYVIAADDVLTIVFWREQQLSGDVLVRPDGKISLPLIDDIPAAGLTPIQLRDRLVTEARRFVTDPVVTVVVRQINSRRVYITGMVARPGQYALTSAMTVLQLIATAGGLGDYANGKDIRLVRTDRGHSKTFKLNYEDMTKQPAQQNMELRPGDTVVVP